MRLSSSVSTGISSSPSETSSFIMDLICVVHFYVSPPIFPSFCPVVPFPCLGDQCNTSSFFSAHYSLNMATVSAPYFSSDHKALLYRSLISVILLQCLHYIYGPLFWIVKRRLILDSSLFLLCPPSSGFLQTHRHAYYRSELRVAFGSEWQCKFWSYKELLNFVSVIVSLAAYAEG
jgi:hypothetical protein